jgi:murein DD-endopeptidase MepM/ murein hydrolase activator NlpD
VEKPKKKIYRKLKNKYRLVFMNDETLEEKLSFTLSPLNVFVFSGTIIISLITFTIYIIAFTPLREYIPGYADVNMQRKLVQLTNKADSLAARVNSQDLWIGNLRNIINGQAGIPDSGSIGGSSARFDTIRFSNPNTADSLLRAQIESQDRFSIEPEDTETRSGIAGFLFFPPLKGTITNTFNSKTKHYGVDIVAPPNEIIKSTLDGTVVMAEWTSETGYVIAIQHGNNIFSIYKHNSALLKKAGDYIKAGDPVAIIGNTGELTTGPHLHFELWYNGSPVNPSDYMTF